MSRSRKRHPYVSMTYSGRRAGAENKYKTIERRRYRRAVSMALRRKLKLNIPIEEVELPCERKYGDPWLGAKDGKCRMSGPEAYRK